MHRSSAIARRVVDEQQAGLGSPGIDEIRWLKPVRPGDSIRAQRTVLETRASQSKPDMGVVKTRWEVYNQKNELVNRSWSAIVWRLLMK